jgi:hypothetical protein
MIHTGFMEWRNPDLSIDLICLSCFETVAQSRGHADLQAAEKDHVCNPSDLVLLRSALPPDYGQEKAPTSQRDIRAV